MGVETEFERPDPIRPSFARPSRCVHKTASSPKDRREAQIIVEVRTETSQAEFRLDRRSAVPGEHVDEYRLKCVDLSFDKWPTQGRPFPRARNQRC